MTTIAAKHLGLNACHDPAATMYPDRAEIPRRIGMSAQHGADGNRCARELICATCFGEGRLPVPEIVACCSALSRKKRSREEIKTSVELIA